MVKRAKDDLCKEVATRISKTICKLHARSWSELKRALTREIGNTMNSRIHQELNAVKKKPEESYQEYIYRVLDLASHGNIKLEAKIQYIIAGV